MSSVTVGQIYYAQLIVTDKLVTPEITAPVDPGTLVASVTLDGAAYTATPVVFTATSEIGIYRMSLDCVNIAAGKTLLITGSYSVNGTRYAFADDVFIDAAAANQLRKPSRESLSRHFRNLYVFGDSLSTGDAASSKYMASINTELGTTMVNSSVSGRGVRVNAIAAHTAIANKTSALISWMVGINDLNRATNKAKTLRKIEGCIYSMLLNAWGDVYTSPSNVAVTLTGTTGTYNAPSVGGKLSDARRGTGLPWTMSWDVTGDSFGLGMIGSDGVAGTHGSATVSVDGVVIDFIDLAQWFDGVNDGENANTLGPVGRIYTGLGAGAHTILLNGVDGANFVVDFFCTMLPKPRMPTVMLHEISFQSNVAGAGYALHSVTNGGGLNDDNYTRQANAIIRRIVTSLADQGFPIILGQTNSYLDVAETTDGLHWTVPGHDAVFAGFFNDLTANSAKYQTLSPSGLVDHQSHDLRSKANTIAAVDDSTTGTNAATAATQATNAATQIGLVKAKTDLISTVRSLIRW